MELSNQQSRLARMTRAQYFWAFTGLGVLVVVAVVARGDLNSLYKAEPDFFVGSLLALTGFSFAKAFSRVTTDAAVAMIRQGTDPEVQAALQLNHERRLQTDGVLQQVALLARNVTAANKRASEYYDLQAREP